MKTYLTICLTVRAVVFCCAFVNISLGDLLQEQQLERQRQGNLVVEGKCDVGFCLW